MLRLRSLIASVLMTLALALVLLAPAPAAAQADDEMYRENSDISKMFEKLGRGASNVLLGWLEVPKNIAKEWRRTEPFTGTIVGAVKGVGWGVVRTLAGVYEVVTFPFPVPRAYEPVMYPEFILPTIWGDRLPLYKEEFLQGENRSTAPLHSVTNAPMGADNPYPAGNVRSY